MNHYCSEMKRIFLALDMIPDEQFRKELVNIQQSFIEGIIKWVDPDHMHLTIRFFGETEERNIPLISDATMKAVAEIHPFQLTFSSLGVFKSIRQPRVIWIGCNHQTGLMDLNKKTEIELVRNGFPSENRKFSPHLTLGRIRSLPVQNKLVEVIEHYKEYTFLEQFISRITLYESILKKTGPEYIAIQTFEMKGGKKI